MRHSTSIGACVLLLAFGVAPGTASDDPGTPRGVPSTNTTEIQQRYTVTTWSTRDGLPAGAVTAVAQSADGFLWLGTSEGLVRFDGTSFEVDTSVPREPVRALCATRDGSLWVGFSQGVGIARIQHAAVKRYDTSHGLSSGVASGIVEDAEGRLWVGDPDGLRRLVDDRFIVPPEREGFPEGDGVTSLSLDRSGHLLVGTYSSVYRWQPARDAFDEVAPGSNAARVAGLGEDESGHVWVTDGVTGFRRLDGGTELRPSARARGVRVLRDRQGGMWFSTTGDGLWRIEPLRFGASSPIARAPISGGRSVFEDRDGNVWVGTIEGLVRLSERRMPQLSNLGPVSSIESTPDGYVWIGATNGLLRFSMADSVWEDRPQALSNRPVRATHVASDGTLWVADATGLWRRRDQRLAQVETPVPIIASAITALSTSPDGHIVWIAMARGGLIKWSLADGTAQPITALSTVRVSNIFADSRGRVWLTSEAGRLGVLQDHQTMRWFDSRDGLGVPTSYAFLEGRDGVVWVSGHEGLWGYRGDRFQAVVPADHAHWSVPTLVDDRDGDLWLGTAYGIAWVTRAELARWFEDPAYRVRYSLFDASDGLAGLPGVWGGRTSVRNADDNLWFVTGRGITLVSPRELKRQRSSVAVRIARVAADGHDFAFGDTTSIDPAARQLLIDYRALELTAPDKVRFRYRLEGFDAEWVEAGGRRQAIYRDLPARQYRFLVSASNTEGIWSEPALLWAFSISPPFHETPQFIALLVASVVVAVWAFWQLRLRRSRQQFATLLGERVRLSRELHDTLLQSLVGVALQFEAASSSVEPSSPARQRLMTARRQVEDYIREARLSIWNLRSPHLTSRDLVTALRDTAERVSASTVPVSVDVQGAAVQLPAEVEEQLVRIGQEAILNSARHADARHVSVEVEFGRFTVTLRVSDDGRGFDASRWLTNATGHLGLVSMKERAEQVGGRFALHSVPGVGTHVEAVVPLRAPMEATA